MSGKVWLVGAGPSDAGLMTVKGSEVLKQAEVVVYDALVGKSILGTISEKAEAINVGKRSGHHTMKQEEINQLLAEKALEGKRVVRLKGGDPFLFGRGGEEIEVLRKAGVEYEVVPGVTSALSVPAYNGIPVTHRDFSSTLHIITAHKKEGEKLNLDFESLVKLNGTLIFLMGVSALEDICNGLIASGMKKDMEAAVLEQGTTARQRKAVATVSTLKEEAEKAGIKSPAIIVVGRVCSLADKFAWYENKELFGKRILVTRPRKLSSKMAERLRNKGAEVLEVPAVSIEPIEENKDLKEALQFLLEYSVIVFTSPSGVQVFFDKLKEEKTDIRKLFHLKIAVIGRGTAKELEERGIFADYMPKEYEGRALGKLLGSVCTPEDKILIPRAAQGNPELIEEAAKSGAEIRDIPIYQTVYKKSRVLDVAAEITAGQIDYVAFTSASTVKSFVEMTGQIDFSQVNAVCIGRKTEEAAKKYGMKTFVSKEATIDSMEEKIMDLSRE